MKINIYYTDCRLQWNIKKWFLILGTIPGTINIKSNTTNEPNKNVGLASLVIGFTSSNPGSNTIYLASGNFKVIITGGSNPNEYSDKTIVHNEATGSSVTGKNINLSAEINDSVSQIYNSSGTTLNYSIGNAGYGKVTFEGAVVDRPHENEFIKNCQTLQYGDMHDGYAWECDVYGTSGTISIEVLQ